MYRTCIHVFPSRTCTCHIAVVASKLAVARQRPSGDQARARTVRDCSSKMEVHAHWLSLEATPGAQLQMRTILSPLQLASILPATDTCASCHHIPLRLNLNAALFNVGVFWLCYPSQAAQLFTTVRPPQVLSTAMFELSVFISMPVTLCVCVCVCLWRMRGSTVTNTTLPSLYRQHCWVLPSSGTPSRTAKVIRLTGVSSPKP